MPTINFAEDFPILIDYVKRRVKQFSDACSEPVHFITLGYEYSQSGFIVLSFDTRTNAVFDGTWNNDIEASSLPLEHWSDAVSDMSENGARLTMITTQEKRRYFTASTDEEKLATAFGEFCRFVLEKSREEGLFKTLNQAEDCSLAVEHQNGIYGWLEYETDADSEQFIENWNQEARPLSPEQAVEFWIEKLRFVIKKPVYPERLTALDIYEQLEPFHQTAVIPLLNLLMEWVDQPEFFLTEHKTTESHPWSLVLRPISNCLSNWRIQNPEIEAMLRKYIQVASQQPPLTYFAEVRRTKVTKQLYGRIPILFARILHEQFDGYPPPNHGPSNRLKNLDEFV